ncbi:MAG: tight adherence protein, partial [Actinomycetota bacterium]|nr:tight adherence protein [Actinomycetota bacterium]
MAAAILLPLAVLALGAALRSAITARRRAVLVHRLPAPFVPRRSGATPTGGPPRRSRPFGLPSLPSPPGWVAPALADAAVDVPAGTAWWGWLAGLAAGTALAATVSGPAAGVLVALALAVVPPLALRARRGRADVQLERHLPLALESIARSLRSGASARQAVGEAAAAGGCRPLQEELAMVAAQAGHGYSLVAALEALAERRRRPGVRLAVAALCLGIDTGGAQARAVDGVAATMRERLGVEAEVRALSSQARVSALVIGLAPLGFGAFAAATDPRTSQFLLHTP